MRDIRFQVCSLLGHHFVELLVVPIFVVYLSVRARRCCLLFAITDVGAARVCALAVWLSVIYVWLSFSNMFLV